MINSSKRIGRPPKNQNCIDSDKYVKDLETVN